MRPGSVLLETARPDRENSQTLFFSDPRDVLVAYKPSQVREVLAELDDWVDRGYFIAGYMDYEAGFAFEEIAELGPSDKPILWFGVYDHPSDPDPEWFESISEANADPNLSLEPRFSLSKAEYSRQIRTIKEHLLEGNVYQINLTGSFEFAYDGLPFDLYRQLRSRQPVGYNACLVLENRAIISCSPELFFRRDENRIWTRPMKGTVRRGANPDEDVVLSNWLRSDSKSLAENLMIVDLLRNDLSRVCEIGSVEVPAMFSPELYETVIQLTTTVSGTLKSGASYSDIFAALFPCGSITGAPKVRAMKIILEIERRRRGVYTGTIGYVGPDERAVFSVAIRTVTLSDSRGRMGSGGGIVWDSVAEAEYRECLLKAAFLTGQPEQPDLIETLVWEPESGYQRLEKHLRRIGSSAAELGYMCDIDMIRAGLERLEQALGEGDGAIRIRLLLHSDGEMAISHRPLLGPSIFPGTVVVSELRRNPADVWLYHKTTRREVYDAEYASAMLDGHVEVIYLNENGEVTEGSRTNLFIRRGDELLTPPVTSGLLAGTRRAEILETMPNVTVATLTMRDLKNADEILLCNGTSPLTPVRLMSRS